VVNPTIDGIVGMLEKGQADIVGWYLDSKQGKRLDTIPHLKMVRAPSHGLHEIRPHCNLKPTSDPKFRQAFQHAMNRRAMRDVILEGYGSVCHNTPINPLIKLWNNPDIPVIEFDLDKAKSILKSAGYTWDARGRLCYP
jgi:peptide/nickel transport system substrate-binding protein